MKTIYRRMLCSGTAMMLSMPLFSQPSFPQATDSLSGTSSGSLQFQLIGGVGVNYLSDFGPMSFMRIGIDGSLSHSSESGDGRGYSEYSFGGGSPSSSSTARQPEQEFTSWNVSISGVFARKIVGYANTVLYCGAGPMASYSYGSRISSSSYTRTEASGTYLDTNVSDNTSKTWGIGPLVLVGVRTQLLDHVGLSAEVNLSALYQWQSQTNASRSTTTYSPTSRSTNSYGEMSNVTGWQVSLSNIRIGVIIDL